MNMYRNLSSGLLSLEGTAWRVYSNIEWVERRVHVRVSYQITRGIEGWFNGEHSIGITAHIGRVRGTRGLSIRPRSTYAKPS